MTNVIWKMENELMSEKICLVTGASSGIGKVTAKALAGSGATLIIVCRSLSKGEAARNEIVKETGAENVDLMIAEFSDLSEVRRLAADVKAKYPRLHTLINNAGTYNGKRTLTAEGYEAT